MATHTWYVGPVGSVEVRNPEPSACSMWRYPLDAAVQAEGITWHQDQFRDWLGGVSDAKLPLDVWRYLYGEYQRIFDARDERDTQRDALT